MRRPQRVYVVSRRLVRLAGHSVDLRHVYLVADGDDVQSDAVLLHVCRSRYRILAVDVGEAVGHKDGDVLHARPVADATAEHVVGELGHRLRGVRVPFVRTEVHCVEDRLFIAVLVQVEMDASAVAVRHQGYVRAVGCHVQTVYDMTGQLHRAVVVLVRAAGHVQDEGDVELTTTR